MSGNNVSHANNRTRRRFLPNLHTLRFWLEKEKRYIKLRVSAKGLRMIDKLGIEGKLDLHAIRHSALTRFARNGATQSQLQAIAGHSDPTITARIYTHLNVEDLRSAVEEPNNRTESVEAKEAR